MGSEEKSPSQETGLSFRAPTVAFCMPNADQGRFPFSRVHGTRSWFTLAAFRFRFKSLALVALGCPRGRRLAEAPYGLRLRLAITRSPTQNTRSPQNIPPARGKAPAHGAPMANDLAPATPPRGGRSHPRPAGPLRPRPSAGGNDDRPEEHGGGFHFGAFLCPAEAIG